MRFLLLTLTILCLPAAAASWMSPCFVSFYSLSADDPQARELLASTYDKLLDLPLEGRVREQMLASLENGGDPFSVSADRPELFFVSKHLAEFRRMLEQLGWDTPENRAHLISIVQRRRGGITLAEAKLHDAIAGARLDEQLSFNGAAYVQPVPGGRYFVGRRSDPWPSKDTWVFVYDRQTKAETKVPGYHTGRVDHPVVSSDGKQVAVPVGFDMMVHDLKDGKLSSPGKRVKGMGLVRRWLRGGVDWLGNTTALANPNWIVAQLPDADILRLYDMEKGTVRTIGGHGPFITGYKTEEKMSWGVVQGQNALVALTPTKTGSSLQYGTLDAKGRAKWKTVASFPPSTREYKVFYGPIAAGPRYVLLKGHPNFENLNVVDLNDGSVRDLAANHPTKKNLNRVEMHPNGKEVMTVSYFNEGNYYAVHWMDLETGKTTEIVQTGAGYIDLSPDGESILIRGMILSNGNTKSTEFLRIVNPRARLVP